MGKTIFWDFNEGMMIIYYLCIVKGFIWRGVEKRSIYIYECVVYLFIGFGYIVYLVR